MDNGVLKVEVSLGDVLLDDRSINDKSARVSNPVVYEAFLTPVGASFDLPSDAGEISERSLLGPVADEGSLTVRRVLVE